MFLFIGGITEALRAFSSFTANELVNKSIEQMYDKLIVDNSDAVDNDDSLNWEYSSYIQNT